MRVSGFLGCAFGLLTVLGCQSSIPSTHPPSSLAIHDYRDARRIYLEAIGAGLRGDEIRAALQSALAHAQAAIDQPPVQPMFLAARADLLAADSTQSVANLEEAYRLVLDACPQWIPAWIALARLAAEEGHFRAAEQHLADGERLLEDLEEFEPHETLKPWESAFWLGLPYYDPTLPESVRHQAISQQLLAWFTWEDALRQPADTPADTIQETEGDVGSRLRARLLLERLRVQRAAMLADHPAGSPDACRAIVRTIEKDVLPLDAEFLEAEVLRAECLASMGEYRVAESVLGSLTDPRRTRLANDPRLLGLLLDVYVDWLVASRGEMLDADSRNDGVAISRAEVLEDSIQAVLGRLGSAEHMSPRALLRAAETYVLLGEWRGGYDEESLPAVEQWILPAARNAISRTGAIELLPIVADLEERDERIRRAMLAKRKNLKLESAK